ncbi:hypothetical protein J4Q44_G00199380, partial [Coregonus suidteri]
SAPYYTNSTFSFRNSLEVYDKPDGEAELDTSVNNLHNLVHSFLNGTSALSHSAANDPIFLVLHAFTDAIFDEWMRKSVPPNSSFPYEMAPIGHNRDYNMVVMRVIEGVRRRRVIRIQRVYSIDKQLRKHATTKLRHRGKYYPGNNKVRVAQPSYTQLTTNNHPHRQGSRGNTYTMTNCG